MTDDSMTFWDVLGQQGSEDFPGQSRYVGG